VVAVLVLGWPVVVVPVVVEPVEPVEVEPGGVLLVAVPVVLLDVAPAAVRTELGVQPPGEKLPVATREKDCVWLVLQKTPAAML
jgi:hypothetical protein